MMFAAYSLNAQQAPNDTLEAVTSQLEASTSKVAKLQQNASSLEQELGQIQRKLVDVTEALRKKELNLQILESQASQLRQEKQKTEENLRNRREEIERLMQSLIRLARTPPEAVIAMPGQLRHTLQTASILQQMTQEIQRQSVRLNAMLVQLDKDREALAKTESAVQAELSQMQLAQKALDTQLQTRQRLQHRLNRQQSEEQQRISSLSQQAASLRDLITKLEEQRKALPAHAKLKIQPRLKPSAPAKPRDWQLVNRNTDSASSNSNRSRYEGHSLAESKGHMRLPVVGRIISRFGEKLRANETQKGLLIQARSGAQVIAPVGSKVVFTGPFLDYGQMVILRLKGGYHLLLAGLGDIQCEAGQRLAAGEPVGRVGAGTSAALSALKGSGLYLELRQGSKPVDPSPWFG